MSQAANNQDVLTLEEVAGYLRVSIQAVEELAERGTIPGRRVQHEWRFLKCALENWLCGPDDKQALLNQAGALAGDDSLPKMLTAIYAKRRRP